jgi:hypothetical protein
MSNPFRSAAITATVIVILSELPLVLIFLALHVPSWLSEKFIYAIPLMALGTPGANIVYGSTRAGLKYLPLIFVVNWALYFALAYLVFWMWFACKYLRSAKPKEDIDE